LAPTASPRHRWSIRQIVNELTIAEAAYLAALPKAPAALHPVRNRDRAIERRNYVVDRLVENGWIKQADADKARKDPLTVTNRSNAAHIFAGEYFAEEVRRDVFERYGEKNSMKAACRYAPRSIEAAGDGTQDHDRRPRELR